MDDRSWLGLPRNSPAFLKRVDDFLNFAHTNKPPDSLIYCPCKVCANRYYRSRNDVREHIVLKGFLERYKNWTYHGESHVSLHQNQEQERIDISLSSEFRDNCLNIAGALWRRWKGQVKHDYYKKYDTDEERLLNRPDRVQRDQWEALVIYWGNEKTQVIARINKRNREYQVLNHTTGKKKHAQVRDEMESRGEETDRVAVFIETHKPKEGCSQSSETAAAIAEMKSRLDAVPVEEHTTSFKEMIFTDVVGPDVRGRVKTYGAGATSRTVFGTGAGMQTKSRDMEMEQRIVEKVNALLDSRIAKVINLFRSGLEGESRRVGDGPSSIGNQVPTGSSVHRPNSETDENANQDDEVIARD